MCFSGFRCFFVKTTMLLIPGVFRVFARSSEPWKRSYNSNVKVICNMLQANSVIFQYICFSYLLKIKITCMKSIFNITVSTGTEFIWWTFLNRFKNIEKGILGCIDATSYHVVLSQSEISALHSFGKGGRYQISIVSLQQSASGKTSMEIASDIWFENLAREKLIRKRARVECLWRQCL